MAQSARSVVDQLMLIGALVSLGCSGFGDGLRNPRAVNDAIAERVAKGAGTEVRLDELTPFGWRRVYVFGPYTSLATIRDSLGRIDLRDAAKLARNIEVRDDIDLLVFQFEHVGEQSMEHPRNQGDFGLELVGRGYGPNEAIFVVREAAPGGLRTLGPRRTPGGLTLR